MTRGNEVRFAAYLPSLLVSLATAGCMAPVGSELSVPPDAAKTCAEHCESIGMRLSAVAIMASNVGCVCQDSKGAAAAASDEVAHQSATSAAGMATILMQQAAEENARHQRATQQHQVYKPK